MLANWRWLYFVFFVTVRNTSKKTRHFWNQVTGVSISDLKYSIKWHNLKLKKLNQYFTAMTALLPTDKRVGDESLEQPWLRGIRLRLCPSPLAPANTLWAPVLMVLSAVVVSRRPGEPLRLPAEKRREKVSAKQQLVWKMVIIEINYCKCKGYYKVKEKVLVLLKKTFGVGGRKTREFRFWVIFITFPRKWYVLRFGDQHSNMSSPQTLSSSAKPTVFNFPHGLKPGGWAEAEPNHTVKGLDRVSNIHQ